MKTVFILIDRPNLDYLLVPIIEELRKSGYVRVVTCVCDFGSAELLEDKGLPFTRDLSSFDEFINHPGKKLFLNAADLQHDAHLRARNMEKKCRKKNIPTLTVKHGSFSLVDGPWGDGYLFGADRIAIYARPEYQQYTALGVSPERLVITGCSKYDYYYHLDKREIAQKIREQLNIDDQRGYILFAGENHRFTGLGYKPYDWVESLGKVFKVLTDNFPNLDIIIKPHPAEPYNHTIQLYSDAISSELSSRIRIIDAHEWLPHFVCGSDFVFSFAPSVLLETLLLQKPVVMCAGPTLSPAIVECEKAGAVIVQSEWLQMDKALREKMPILLQDTWKHTSPSEAFVERFAYKWDGLASHRISILIDRMLEQEDIPLEDGIMTGWSEDQKIKRPVLYDVGFERYQRLMGIAEETHIGEGETISLLDVGSEDAYFQNLVPNIEYHSYDGFISSRNGAFLPYSDDSFDIVTAADVLEHVIPEDRQLFIYELIRVSKRRVIISFPNEMSAESEDLILSFVPHYRWLREHQRNGLPKAEEVEKYIIDLGLSYKIKQNASMATWIYSVLFDQGNFNDQAKTKLNTFIQKNFYEFENNEPAYRSIYTIDIPSAAEKKGLLAKIDNYLCSIKQTELPQVSIIIPVFNKVAFTRKCLDALYKNTPNRVGFEVIVVDNASTDDTSHYLKEASKQYSGLRALSNSENLGFARSCNQGARAASSEYLLFLNNDTEVQGGWIEPLMTVLDRDPNVVAVGSKMLFPDNTIQHAGVIVLHDKRLPDPLGAMHVHSKQAADFSLANQLCTYQALTAACMIMRRSDFEAVGGYDEAYWNGFEDVDLCFKFQEKGGLLVYHPESVVIHYESQSGPERFRSHDVNIKRLNQKWFDKVTEDLVIEADGKLTPNKTGHIRHYEIPGASSKVEKKKSIVSIVIPVFNQLEFTKQCFESIKRNTIGINYEIIIIDNGSSDGTREFLQGIKNEAKIIENKQNLGFAKACNQGALAAQSKYVLFLNNDIKVNPDWLELLINVLDDDSNVAAVGSKLLFPDGTIQHAGVMIIDDRKLPDPLVGRHIHYRKEPDSPEANQRFVYQALTAACLLVRKSAYHDVGGFDEGYWNGYEDVDLCFKLGEKGWTLVYEPKSSAVHYESQSGPERFRQVSGNIERLHQKWLGKITPDVVIETDGKIGDPGAGKIAPYEIFKSTGQQSGKPDKISNALTSIIILAHNQLEYTKKCLESILKYTKEPFELIIVDNGSTDNTVQYLENMPAAYGPNTSKERTTASNVKGRKKNIKNKKSKKTDPINHSCQGVKVIKNDENLGFAAGNNQGISVARGNYILLMNNDVVVTPGWLGRLTTCAERDQKIGIVGPMTNYVPGQQLVKDVRYNTTSLARLNKFTKEFSGKYSGQGKHVLRVVGFCMFIKRAVIDKIGGLDDRYGLGNFEDDDFSLRATLGGFESWIAEDCFIHHFGSRTFIGSGIDYNESLNKNWDIFKQKWEMPSDLPYGSYNFSQIGRKTFNPEKDYIPVDWKGNSEIEEQQANRVLMKNEYSSVPEIHSTKIKKAFGTSIIICISSQQKYMKRCIESIKMHTDEPHEVIFVDNGTTKGVLKWLRPMVQEKANYQLIEVLKNAGLAKSYNEGIRASTGGYNVLLHDDVVVTGGWLSGMLECIQSAPDVGIVGPMSNNSDGIQKDHSADYSSIDHLAEYAEKFRQGNRYRHVPANNLSGYCFLCRREVIEKIGLFDEEIDSEEFLLKDYCLRAELEGHKNIIASDVFVHHSDTHKVIKDKLNGEGISTKGRKVFVEKWETIKKTASHNKLGKRLLYLDTVKKADELNQRDQIHDAFNLLLETITHFPDDEGLYYALSDILMNNKQFKDALDVLNEIPSDGQIVRKLEREGYCQEGMEAYGEAEDYADRVLTINPASAPALNLKGMLAYRKGDEKAAKDFFNRAIDSDPSYGEPHANLGFMKWSAKLEDDALDLFEKAFILTPTVTDIFTNYHAAVKALGKYERAEQYFKDACKLYPKNKRLKYLLIDVLIQQAKHSMAMDEIGDAMIEFGMDEGSTAAALEVRNKLGPQEIKSSSRNATISLCMIVKNEEKHLGKCLKNLDSVVDEMIVVDTGSTDATKEISAIFGAKVYDFEWTNDFSEARNCAISKASGDWIFVVDADEIISPIDHEALRKLAEKPSPRPTAYSFVTRNYNMRTDIIGLNANDGRYDDEEAGVGWVSSEKVRLFRNDGKIKFEYPVHEMVEPFLRQAGIEIKRCSIPIHHYGQLNQDMRTCKGEEYYQMGIKKLDEMDDDVNAIYELAVQAGMLEKWEEAIALWKRLLALRPHVPVAFVNMGTAFQKIGKFDEAIQCVERAMALDSDMKEAPNDYALYCLYSGNAAPAIPVLEKLVRKYPDYLSAQFKLAVAYICIGRKQEGLAVLEKLGQTAMGSGLAISCHTIAKKLISIQRNDYAEAILEAAIESQNVNEDVLALLNACRAVPDRGNLMAEKMVEPPEMVLGA